MSWEIVGRLLEGGLVARRDLSIAGVHPRWLHRQVATERLICVHPGVLRLPDLKMDLDARFRAALLQAGPDAALSHTSALEIYGLLEDWDHGTIHVAVPRAGVRSCPGVSIHKRPRGVVERVDGLPVVSPKDALVGGADLIDITNLRFPAMKAVQIGLLSPGGLADLAGVPMRARAVIRLVGEEALAGAESGGEANYYRLLLDSHLPVPKLQKWVNTSEGWKRIDAYWEELALGCEIDGERFHGDKQARDRDRTRRNAIQATAVKLFDFSVEEVMRSQRRVLEETEANLLARAHELRVKPWWLAGSVSGKANRL